MITPARQSRWRSVLPGILLAVLVFVVYFPSLNGEFLWDDDSNVVKSAPLRSLAGLWQIWFHPGATQQYYPLTHSSFWLDFHIWGLNTFGYHLENILLHAATSILLWLLLRRLSIKGAWLGAALFALHPVNVESVAWITERKNCLSGPFFMLSLLAAVKFWQLDGYPTARPAKHWKYYFASLAFFLCALLSKTATIGLPAIILLLIWWKRRFFRSRDFLLLVPFVVIGIALALVTMFLEKNHLGATGPEWNFSFAQRCIIAGRALWFYLGKLLWPHPLTFMYPLWTIRPSQIVAYLPLVVALAGLVVLALTWKSWARAALLAAVYFFVMLIPVLGFFNVVFYHYSFVCDHFQYLASIGPLVLIAAAITLGLDRLLATLSPIGGEGRVRGFVGQSSGIGPPNRANADSSPSPGGEGWGEGGRFQLNFAFLIRGGFMGRGNVQFISTVVLIPFALLSSHQIHVYHDSETLWNDTLAHNPGSWMAHDNLGTIYSARGQFSDAAKEYLKALEVRPDDYMAWNDMGLDAARRGQLDDAVQYFTQALQFLPNYALGHYNLGNVFARKEKFDDAIQQFNTSLQLNPDFAPAHYSLASALALKGDTAKAIDEYNTTLQLDPDFAPAHAGLGRVLAAKGDLANAVAQFRAALDLDPGSVDALANLGNALVTQKNYDDAIKCYRAAIQLNPNSATLHYNLAVALDRSGDKVESQKELAEASRLKSLTAPAH